MNYSLLKKRFRRWKKDITANWKKILLAFLFLAVSLLSTFYTSHYVDRVNTVAVPDIILDSIPVVDLSVVFVWGAALVIIFFIAYPLFFRPKRFHYALGMLSLFYLTRSLFIVLTHLKAPTGAVVVETSSFFQRLIFSNDLFFSGHTGLPFLGFLVFKGSKVRYFMLASSIILAITVLLMHIHYSIDVASAFFITYGIYTLGGYLFGDNGDSGKE
jgi:hypothetical protein